MSVERCDDSKYFAKQAYFSYFGMQALLASASKACIP
jgi:hypothetical protein